MRKGIVLMGYAFISYSSQDYAYAQTMHKVCTDLGIKTWMAPGDIPAGNSYAGVITNALKGADCLVLLLTDHAQNSKWVDREVERALTYNKMVIPIALEDIRLNDNFEFYLGNQQIVPVKQLDRNNADFIKVLNQIKAITGIVEEQKSPEGEPKIENTEYIFFLRRAESGDVSAQSALGRMFENGQGVSQDYTKACEWFRKAAEQNDTYAQYSLGRLYELGQGVEQDYTTACEWYRRGAELGYMYAQNSLGRMYEYGQGVELDYTAACKWYRKAAEQGNTYAMDNLGLMYENGYGVDQDYMSACEWYRKAAEQGNIYAMAHLGRMYENGRGVEKDLKTAKEYYVTAAKGGNKYIISDLRRIGAEWQENQQ